jgi:hypothetical protein
MRLLVDRRDDEKAEEHHPERDPESEHLPPPFSDRKLAE